MVGVVGPEWAWQHTFKLNSAPNAPLVVDLVVTTDTAWRYNVNIHLSLDDLE